MGIGRGYGHGRGIFKANEFEVIREKNNMPRIEKVERECLRCDVKFLSRQKNIRLCPRCRLSVAED